MAKRRRIFVALTPLGHRVVLTRDRWREIIRFKHPVMAGQENVVRDCLSDPNVIRASAKDAGVHAYYRQSQRGYVCVVVTGHDPQDRFVVTAYLTKTIKKGQDLWTK